MPRYMCRTTEGLISARNGTGTASAVSARCAAAIFVALFGSLALYASPFAQLNAGKSFWIRLLDPVASYSSKPGTPVRAALIQSPECDSTPVFPPGLEVDGILVAVRKVGLGIKHDTASLTIRFDRFTTAEGTVLPLNADIVEIDNAREHLKNGVIRGIRATNTPQGRITSRLLHCPRLIRTPTWASSSIVL